MDLITVYVSIGNSDNKCSQSEWAQFIEDFRRAMRRYAKQVYGEWYSAPDSEYGPNGELLYAGQLKAREDGGWDATPDGASLPADEVEPDALQWGYREHPAEDVDPVREEYARFRAADDHLTLVQREVRYGPWVAVPVEPKGRISAYEGDPDAEEYVDDVDEAGS